MLSDDAVLQIARLYRFQWEPAQQAHVLLFPEGMIKLPGSSGEILKRVNGAASVGDIVADLERAFPGTDLRLATIAWPRGITSTAEKCVRTCPQ